MRPVAGLDNLLCFLNIHDLICAAAVFTGCQVTMDDKLGVNATLWQVMSLMFGIVREAERTGLTAIDAV